MLSICKSTIFEDMCRYYTLSQGLVGRLNCLVANVGSWWSPGHDHKPTDIDFGEYGGIQSYRLFELTKESYDQLDEKMSEADAIDIMYDNRKMYMSVDDRCGSPYTIVFDDDYEKLCPWAKAIKSGKVWPEEMTDAVL